MCSSSLSIFEMAGVSCQAARISGNAFFDDNVRWAATTDFYGTLVLTNGLVTSSAQGLTATGAQQTSSLYSIGAKFSTEAGATVTLNSPRMSGGSLIAVNGTTINANSLYWTDGGKINHTLCVDTDALGENF
jgi:hypothetical protein